MSYSLRLGLLLLSAYLPLMRLIDKSWNLLIVISSTLLPWMVFGAIQRQQEFLIWGAVKKEIYSMQIP